jgi:molybdopterin molybdotransferase
MIELAQARMLVRGSLAQSGVAVERVPLASAHGRYLAQELRAPADVPGFANAAMDGYAVRASDLHTTGATRLRIVATLMAGGAAVPAVGAGECVRIMTGAPVPVGADTVVVREHASVEGAEVVVQPGTAVGANLRPADDDFAAGALALPAGARLDAAALGVIASFGHATVAVRTRLRVAILVTGDELVEPGLPLAFGQRYNSNRSLLGGLVHELGAVVSDSRRVVDDPHAIEHVLRDMAPHADLLLTTGGASAGDADFLPALLARIGKRVFWKVAMRPGMPVLFGVVEGLPMFGLPGNPVSVLATFFALVRPAIAQLTGAPAIDPPPIHARLVEPLGKGHQRLEFRRARLQAGDDGMLYVRVHPTTSSGALRSVLEADALVELAAPAREYLRGDLVPVHRIRSVECLP